jgi:hypothetical protein
MITRFFLTLFALHVSLFATPPVGSWEPDPQRSLEANGKLNPQERRMVLGFVDEIGVLEMRDDHSYTLEGQNNTWTQISKSAFRLEDGRRGIGATLKDATHLDLAFAVGDSDTAIILSFVPKGSVIKAACVLPQDFPYYDQAYRSELSMGEGKYRFMKLSKEGTLYEYYGSSEKTVDPAIITEKTAAFSGTLPTLLLDAERGSLMVSKDNIRITLNHAMMGETRFVLATYKDPSLAAANEYPWTQEAIKAYVLKHPQLTYHRKGFDPFEQKQIDDEITFTLQDYPKAFFDNPAGSMYQLSSKEEDGGLYRWSQFSPFVPNHVPVKNADKIVHSIEGQETITTPAGTFTCTILNLDADGEAIKAWMINDRPGVYAKYINAFATTFTLIK